MVSKMQVAVLLFIVALNLCNGQHEANTVRAIPDTSVSELLIYPKHCMIKYEICLLCSIFAKCQINKITGLYINSIYYSIYISLISISKQQNQQ